MLVLTYHKICVCYHHIYYERQASDGRGYAQPRSRPMFFISTARQVDSATPPPPNSVAQVYYSVYYSLLKIRDTHLISA